jgi:hypothetical protein
MEESLDTHLEDKRPYYKPDPEIKDKVKAKKETWNYVLDYSILGMEHKWWTKEFQEGIYKALSSLQRYIFRMTPDLRVEAYRARLATIALPLELSLKITIDTIIPLFPSPMHILDIALTLEIVDDIPRDGGIELVRAYNPDIKYDANARASRVPDVTFTHISRNKSSGSVIVNSQIYLETMLVREGMEFEDSLIKMIADEIIASDRLRNKLIPYVRIAIMSQGTSIADLCSFARDMSASQWREVCRGHSRLSSSIILRDLELGQRWCITSLMVLHFILMAAPKTNNNYIEPMLSEKREEVERQDGRMKYRFSRSSRNFSVMFAQFLRKHQSMARYFIGDAEVYATIPKYNTLIPYEIGQPEYYYLWARSE